MDAMALSDVGLNGKLNTLLELRKCTPEQPYSILQRLKLAKAYQEVGYPDLAAADAYKALLLVDEIAEDGEYYDEALAAALSDLASLETSRDPAHAGCCCHRTPSGEESSDEQTVVKWAKSCWARTAYEILVPCLINCGCLRSAFDYNSRALKAFSEVTTFTVDRDILLSKLRDCFDVKGESLEATEIQDYPDKGLVRRELYPWNDYEPDRFSQDVLTFLNSEMMCISPKLEIKVVELPLLSEQSSSNAETQYVRQLGVFAKEDIPPGQEVLKEKSLLTSVSRLHDSFCDACSIPLPNTRSISTQTGSELSVMACEECDEVFFCGQDCHDLAQENYHPSLCGVSIEQKVSASEAADSLYTLLLIRALALAETQQVHPLELKEVRYIWGDYHGLDVDQIWKSDSNDGFGGIPRTLPFSFEANVLRPLHILEKMEVNIFEQGHRYETWVFNTLYAKFRGTASARQGLDGRPEIGAVHPMWCLANHSCDPNVAWEWNGSMRFWTREQLVDWPGRDPEKGPGLRAGEEVLSHYCDVRLPVKDRREWAVGALGGFCMCARCVWEETKDQSEAKSKQ